MKYGTKSEVKKGSGVDVSKFSKKVDLASLKSYVGQLDIDRLEVVPVGLSKLNNLVDNGIIKRTVYYNLAKKVNTIDTIDVSKLIKKAYHDTKVK